MSERPSSHPGEDEQTRALAPENDNAEQDDADAQAQAQTVADAAVARAADYGLGDSEKVATGDDNDDVQDLVDHMNQMVTSGRIDMDAYRGEPNLDDEANRYGEAANEDGLAADDS